MTEFERYTVLQPVHPYRQRLDTQGRVTRV